MPAHRLGLAHLHAAIASITVAQESQRDSQAQNENSGCAGDYDADLVVAQLAAFFLGDNLVDEALLNGGVQLEDERVRVSGRSVCLYGC